MDVGVLAKVTDQARNREFCYDPYIRLFSDEQSADGGGVIRNLRPKLLAQHLGEFTQRPLFGNEPIGVRMNLGDQLREPTTSLLMKLSSATQPTLSYLCEAAA
jgi:hypothetical protein